MPEVFKRLQVSAESWKINFNYFSFVTDLAAIRKILENETGGTSCPSCKMPFDKGKKRKLIDTCGHDRCYSCMFKNESCTICANTQRHARQEAQRETSTAGEFTRMKHFSYRSNLRNILHAFTNSKLQSLTIIHACINCKMTENFIQLWILFLYGTVR